MEEEVMAAQSLGQGSSGEMTAGWWSHHPAEEVAAGGRPGSEPRGRAAAGCRTDPWVAESPVPRRDTDDPRSF